MINKILQRVESEYRRITKIQDWAKVTQVELAEWMGVTPQTMANWLSRRYIPPKHLVRLAQREKLSLEYLLHGKTESQENGDDEVVNTKLDQMMSFFIQLNGKLDLINNKVDNLSEKYRNLEERLKTAPRGDLRRAK